MYGIILDFDGPVFDGRTSRNNAISILWKKKFPTMGRADLSKHKLLRSHETLILALLQQDLMNEYSEKLLEEYKQILNDCEMKINLNTDLKRVFDILWKSKKVKLAIYSNRRKSNLDELLKSLGVYGYFDDVYGRDSFEPKPSFKAIKNFSEKYNIPYDNITFIGDSDEDYLCVKDSKVNYHHSGYSKEPSYASCLFSKSIIKTQNEFSQILKSAIKSSRMENDNSNIPTQISNSINHNDLVFYAGAGVSVQSGFGDWGKAYRKIYEKLNILHLFKEHDIPSSLQLLFEDSEIDNEVFLEFKNYFSIRNDPNELHYSILNAAQGNIWTTNYDQMFEIAITKADMDRSVVYSDSDWLSNIEKKSLVVKMNGDFERAQYNRNRNWDIIFTQEQFDLYEKNRTEIWRGFEDDFRKKTIVFVGTSLSDPALRRILSLAKQKMPNIVRNHYILIKKSNDLVKSQIQLLQQSSLRNYSIETLFFDTHNDIIRFIQKMAVVKQKPIAGFSGTVDEKLNNNDKYRTSLFTKDETSKECKRLAVNLVEHGYRITSGCGPSVGQPAVEAAFDKKNDSARYYFRKNGGHDYYGTAPAMVVNDSNYTRMREIFVNELNVLLVFCGRVKDTGESSGIIEEIELACKKNIPVIVFRKFGGWADENFDSIKNVLHQYYSDNLFRKVNSLNDKIQPLSKKNLIIYLRNEFINDLNELIKSLTGLPEYRSNDCLINKW